MASDEPVAPVKKKRKRQLEISDYVDSDGCLSGRFLWTKFGTRFVVFRPGVSAGRPGSEGTLPCSLVGLLPPSLADSPLKLTKWRTKPVRPPEPLATPQKQRTLEVLISATMRSSSRIEVDGAWCSPLSLSAETEAPLLSSDSYVLEGTIISISALCVLRDKAIWTCHFQDVKVWRLCVSKRGASGAASSNGGQQLLEVRQRNDISACTLLVTDPQYFFLRQVFLPFARVRISRLHKVTSDPQNRERSDPSEFPLGGPTFSLEGADGKGRKWTSGHLTLLGDMCTFIDDALIPVGLLPPPPIDLDTDSPSSLFSRTLAAARRPEWYGFRWNLPVGVLLSSTALEREAQKLVRRELHQFHDASQSGVLNMTVDGLKASECGNDEDPLITLCGPVTRYLGRAVFEIAGVRVWAHSWGFSEKGVGVGLGPRRRALVHRAVKICDEFGGFRGLFLAPGSSFTLLSENQAVRALKPAGGGSENRGRQGMFEEMAWKSWESFSLWCKCRKQEGEGDLAFQVSSGLPGNRQTRVDSSSSTGRGGEGSSSGAPASLRASDWRSSNQAHGHDSSSSTCIPSQQSSVSSPWSDFHSLCPLHAEALLAADLKLPPSLWKLLFSRLCRADGERKESSSSSSSGSVRAGGRCEESDDAIWVSVAERALEFLVAPSEFLRERESGRRGYMARAQCQNPVYPSTSQHKVETPHRTVCNGSDAPVSPFPLSLLRFHIHSSIVERIRSEWIRLGSSGDDNGLDAVTTTRAGMKELFRRALCDRITLGHAVSMSASRGYACLSTAGCLTSAVRCASEASESLPGARLLPFPLEVLLPDPFAVGSDESIEDSGPGCVFSCSAYEWRPPPSHPLYCFLECGEERRGNNEKEATEVDEEGDDETMGDGGESESSDPSSFLKFFDVGRHTDTVGFLNGNQDCTVSQFLSQTQGGKSGLPSGVMSQLVMAHSNWPCLFAESLLREQERQGCLSISVGDIRGVSGLLHDFISAPGIIPKSFHNPPLTRVIFPGSSSLLYLSDSSSCLPVFVISSHGSKKRGGLKIEGRALECLSRETTSVARFKKAKVMVSLSSGLQWREGAAVPHLVPLTGTPSLVCLEDEMETLDALSGATFDGVCGPGQTGGEGPSQEGWERSKGLEEGILIVVQTAFWLEGKTSGVFCDVWETNCGQEDEKTERGIFVHLDPHVVRRVVCGDVLLISAAECEKEEGFVEEGCVRVFGRDRASEKWGLKEVYPVCSFGGIQLECRGEGVKIFRVKLEELRTGFGTVTDMGMGEMTMSLGSRSRISMESGEFREADDLWSDVCEWSQRCRQIFGMPSGVSSQVWGGLQFSSIACSVKELHRVVHFDWGCSKNFGFLGLIDVEECVVADVWRPQREMREGKRESPQVQGDVWRLSSAFDVLSDWFCL
eukprot:Cvel_29815.t1-p1 / transcript=Cvel_29815.t1 / gene=Cvel_29815 / organism=Chromera_velia_CCMP2878 / gene_product=hypothetical protein / transcript_product=hypothetical protein / location=Cvel_scaffold4151:5559-10798(+) / protein_length=1403 / sequence_SO=supercontig / SO=protein_coding / is_pseudo=false